MSQFICIKSAIIGFAVAVLILSFQKPGQACTLWAAAGNSVLGGGTLIAKNRDWEPLHPQELKMVRYQNGFRFIGLYDKNSEDNSLKAGVNEYGLVVVNAAAPEIALYHHSNAIDLLERILSQCKTVQEVLWHRDWFQGSRFLLLADRRTLMSAEIAPNGIFAVKTAGLGTLCHTNHYLESGLKALNSHPINESSLARYHLISKYLASRKSFSLDDFVQISRSETNGPDNSLWRKGKTPLSSRTLATFLVYQPFWGNPILFVRLANPHDRIQEYYFDLIQLFRKYRPTVSQPFSRRIL